jgi:hypothetical protein
MTNAVEILSAMETDLMVGIVRNLNKGNIGSAEWQARQLARRGRVSDEIVETVRNGTAEAREALSRELMIEHGKARNTSDRMMEGTSLADNLPPDADEALKATLRVWEQRGAEQINRTGANLLASANEMYLDIVEKSTAQALAGDITGRQAMQNISREWANKGLPALTDSAGRRWTTEAYAQTIVRSNVRGVVTDTQLERAKQFGTDLVEISSHVGARPNCEPYQGKVYSVSGQSNKYPSLASTSFGEVDGIGGINCGHDLYPFVDGEKKTFHPYPKKENDQAYENSQRQRQIERNIRRAKRDEAVAKAADDTKAVERARERISNNQKAMRSFIDDTGRTRRRDREQIFT